MPLPLGLAVGALADMGVQVRTALIFWRARQAARADPGPWTQG